MTHAELPELRPPDLSWDAKTKTFVKPGPDWLARARQRPLVIHDPVTGAKIEPRRVAPRAVARAAISILAVFLWVCAVIAAFIASAAASLTLAGAGLGLALADAFILRSEPKVPPDLIRGTKDSRLSRIFILRSAKRVTKDILRSAAQRRVTKDKRLSRRH